MRSVGVRELRERTSQILRDVAEKGENIQVTYHGRVMAHLVPPPKATSREEIEQWREGAHKLMDEIAKHVTEPVDSSTLMQDERR